MPPSLLARNAKMSHAYVKLLVPVAALAAVAAAVAAWLLPGERARPVPASADSAFGETMVNKAAAPAPAPAGMVWIPGGEFTMGSIDPTRCVCSGGSGGDAMGDARPLHRVYVDGFWMDRTEVTNEEFARFVQATGYVTIAEQKPRAEDFPGVLAGDLAAGSTVFTPPGKPVSLADYRVWWRFEKGANWRHPEGPASNIAGKEKYPVVQVAWADAVAYAKWAGKRLPTEAEFEFAARGGAAGKLFAWGDEFKPGGNFMANTFQGEFPNKDTGEDGFVGLAPVGQYAANAYGLYDIAGNAWEWCSDWYSPTYYAELAGRAGVARNPQGPETPTGSGDKEKVQKGGSFLCTDQYCTRYMVGTRGKGEISTAANHVGFRCVK